MVWLKRVRPRSSLNFARNMLETTSRTHALHVVQPLPLGRRTHLTMSLRAAILIISETASRDASTDKGIPALKEVFSQKGGDQWTTEDTRIVTDNVLDIQRAITEWTDGPEYVNLIITSGGTGFAQKDVTPEVSCYQNETNLCFVLCTVREHEVMVLQAITPFIHKHASGLVHTMLASSLAITPCK